MTAIPRRAFYKVIEDYRENGTDFQREMMVALRSTLFRNELFYWMDTAGHPTCAS